jgi:hypothetical protein
MFGLNTFGGLGLALLVAAIVAGVVAVVAVLGVLIDRVAARHEDAEG